MKLAKYLVAAAISSAFIAAPASAGALGAADLTINNFFLTTTTTGPLTPVTTGIQILEEVRTGNASSSFNGVQGTGAGGNDLSSNVPSATVDVKRRCAGPDCGTSPIGENDFTTHLASPQGNFALGDMFIGGSIFNVTGANGLTRANASVEDASNKGSANSTIQNAGSARTTFATNSTITAAFALTYDAYVAALIEAGTPGKASASGTLSWSLTLLKDGVGEVLSWQPTELNKGRFASNEGQSNSYGSSGTIFSPFYTFGPGTYTLAINQASNATASEVPEPGSMILVGLGLAALGAAGRRRRIAK